MNKIFELFLLIVSLFVLVITTKIEPIKYSDLESHWSEFKSKYNKTYFNSTIEEQR
jgi:hypothetical protein